MAEQEVLSFGLNNYGQLGNGGTDEEREPKLVLLPNDTKVVAAAAGAYHGLFLTEDGAAYATGWNAYGQLGTANRISVSTPVQVFADGVQAVAAGYAHSLFLMTDGSVRAAGLNAHGQVGDGSTTDRSSPLSIFAGPATAIAAGYDFSYFLNVSGEVYAVGQNLGGQLGDGTAEIQLLPVRVMAGVKGISAGESHGLFLLESGAVVGTGANFDGQLGDNTSLDTHTPVESLATEVRKVVAGGDSSCFVKAGSGTLFGAGSNRDGQLGLGAGDTFAEPTQVASGGSEELGVTDAGLGDSHGLVVRSDEMVQATGSNSYGELGDGTSISTREFQEVFSLEKTYTATTTGTMTGTGTSSVTTTAEVVVSSTMTFTETESDDNLTTTMTRGTQGQQGLSITSWIWIISTCVALVALLIGLVAQQQASRLAVELEGGNSAIDAETEMAELER